MAVLGREDFLSRIKQLVGENTDDETLALVQDMTETYDNLNGEDWHTKYVDNDKEWRTRYRDAFLNGTPQSIQQDEPEEPDSSQITFDDLFIYKED